LKKVSAAELLLDNEIDAIRSVQVLWYAVWDVEGFGVVGLLSCQQAIPTLLFMVNGYCGALAR
jgi:hypothetical protein